MILKGADHLAALCNIQNEFLVEGFDESWVDQCYGVALGFKFFSSFNRKVVNKPKADQGYITAVLYQLTFPISRRRGFSLG